MAEIPSDIAGSAAQSGFLSREIAKERAAARTGQADASKRQIRSIDEAGDVVDTTDADAQVFTDTEGQGSQGREPDAPPEEEAAPGPGKGITRDEDGTVHLDLEA